MNDEKAAGRKYDDQTDCRTTLSANLLIPGRLAKLFGKESVSLSLRDFLFVIFLVYSLFNYASYGLVRPMLYIGTDFPSLYVAGEIAREGNNPYDTVVLNQTAREAGFKGPKPYVYHPLFAYLFTPLTLFGPELANALFALGNMVLLGAVIWYSIPRNQAQKSELLLLGVVLAANFAPLHNTARMGRVDLVVLFLLTVALYSLRRRRAWVGGILIGLATMLKTTPGLLLVYFLWKRQWRALIAGGLVCGIIAGLGLAVSGPQANLVFWKGLTVGEIIPVVRTDDPVVAEFFERRFESSETLSEFTSRLPGHAWNLSLPAIARHLLDSQATKVLFSSPALARGLGLGASLLLLLSLLWLTRKPISVQPSTDLQELEYGLVVTALVLVPTVTWEHHMTLLLLPVLILARRTLNVPFGDRHWKLWIAFGICYAGLAVAYGWVAGLNSGAGLLAMSTKTYFGLALYGLLAWWLVNERKRATSDSKPVPKV
jgi:hypothetical protein